MNILVTGGAGYAGSHVVRLLLQHGHSVVVADHLAFGGESLLGVWHHPQFRFVHADITDTAQVRNCLAQHQVDAIVHLAAIVGDPACAKNPDLARRVNLDASLNLLESALQRKVARFIYASTCSNYGKMADPEQYVDEASPLAPISLYAELKVKVEQAILRELGRRDGFCPTALRFATIFGVSPRMRFDLTVNEFTKELVLGRPLEIFGEQFWRPYCHVHDFARAVLTVLSSDPERVAYNVFNVGDTGQNYQKQMIVDEIRKVVPTVDVRYVKKQEDPRDYRVSFAKIQRTLDFRISKTVPDGIREIQYCLDHRLIRDPDDAKYRNC